MDINKINKIYMIGIKGVGMTMLAQYLVNLGKEVCGSDVSEKFMSDQVLEKSQIKVIEKFSEKNLPKDADLIVYSTAYNQNTNPELAAALKSQIKTITFPEALAMIFNSKYGIAVCGSHGKTTTSAWLGFVLHKAGLNPSALVGARVDQFDGNVLLGKSDYLVAEIDEYQNKLKYYQPKAVLLNNIEYDHPDYFPTVDDYNQVFIEFIKKIPKNGFLAVNQDDPVIKKIAQVNCRAKIITYAINSEADYVAYDIKQENGKQYFKVKIGSNNFEEDKNINMEDSDLGDFAVSLIGEHNVYNALAVIATAIELNVPLNELRTHLEEFAGTARRMEELGTYRGALIIDDYAHHPTEITTTLKALRKKYAARKITVVFHPHTYTRTKALLDDFAQSFKYADDLIILDIYGSAREVQGGVHALDLVKKIKEFNKTNNIEQIVEYLPTHERVEAYLRENIAGDEIVILMGAGDIFRVGENLLS